MESGRRLIQPEIIDRRAVATAGFDQGVFERKRQIAMAFVAGFREPSLLSVVVALSTCLLMFLILIFNFNEEFIISQKHRYLAHSSSDFHLSVSSEALKMSQSQNMKLIVIAGSSSTRASVRKNILVNNIKDSFSVYKLCTGRQSLWETANLLGKVPDNAEGLVVIGIGPSRFTRNPKELAEIYKNQRFAFNTEAFDEELKLNGVKPQMRFNNYLLDNRRFFKVRFGYLLKNLYNGPPSIKPIYFGLERADRKKLERIYNLVYSRFESFDEKFKVNIGTLERIIKRLRAKTKMRIVLLEHPIDPHFVYNYIGATFYRDYQHRIETFAETNGIPYLNIANSIGLDSDDFYDWAHLRKADLANKYTTILTKHLLEIYETDNN